MNKLLIGVVLMAGLILSLFLAVTLKYDPDQVQMLTKGMALAFHGIWTPYGNAVTGGGFLPGGLLTGLTGIPLLIWDQALAPQLFIILLHLCGVYLFDRALRDYFTPMQRFVFFCLIWLTPWRIGHSVLWNPSYLFFIAAVHFYTASKLANRSSTSACKAFFLSFFHVLIIGLAFQVHASAVILVIISAYLGVGRYIKCNWLGVASAIVVVLCSLIPYFLAMQQDVSASDTDTTGINSFYGYGLVNIYPMLKALLYWPRYTSTIIPERLFSGLSVTTYPVLTLLYYVLGIISMLPACWALCWFLGKATRAGKSLFTMGSCTDHYCLAAFIALVASAALSPINFSNWYLLLILPAAYMVFVNFLWAKLHFLSRIQAGWILGCSCIYLVLLNIGIPFLSHRYDLSNSMVLHYPAIKAQYLGTLSEGSDQEE